MSIALSEKEKAQRGKKENGTVCKCFCSSVTQEINCCRGEKKRKKQALNIQSRREPIKALHCFEEQPLFLSLFPLLLISSDNSRHANSLGSSRIISLQTAAEKIEIISLSLMEPPIATANKTSPVGSARAQPQGAA